jgi:hypothetical protein
MKAIFSLVLAGMLLFGCAGMGDEAPAPAEGPEERGTQIGVISAETSPPEEPGAEAEEPEDSPPEPEAQPPPETSDKKQLVEWYVKNKLMGADGGVRDASGQDTYSSANIWLVMEYAYEKGDRELFDKAYSFLLEKQLDGTHSLAYAELDGAKQPALKGGRMHSNTGDNIRIVKMLYLAHDRWGGDYSDTAIAMADSLFQNSVFTQVLVKESYWSGESVSPSTIMRSDAPDWGAMERMAAGYDGWTGVIERTRSHVLGCREDGLFWPEYDAAALRCQYPSGTGMAATASMLTSAIAFADINAMEPAILTYTKMSNEWNREERISNAYEIPYNGIPNGEEDPGTYAVMGRLSAKLQRCTFAAEMKEKVLEYFVEDEADALYGAIAMDGEAKAYDNLQALIFFEEYEEACGQ